MVDETKSSELPGHTDDAAAPKNDDAQQLTSLPIAKLHRERRISAAWIIPLIAILLAAWLGYSAWRERGTIISVSFANGYGLKIGDPVRHRGIAIGEVREMTLSEDGNNITIRIAISEHAQDLARAGSRFWIVRPRLALSSIEGLETIVGPRYIAFLPGPDDAPRRSSFVGLEEPPIIETARAGDLEIILESARRHNLQPGAAVTYRDVRIGRVLSVGLASDASGVEARVHIEQPYRELVRANTRFWVLGGVETNLGITGVSLKLDSLTTLLVGGIALATPPPNDAGDGVHTGHRFALHPSAEDDWLRWTPRVVIGSALLPAGAPMPQPRRATIAWKQGIIIKGRHTLSGWVLQTSEGLLGPADLLTPRPGKRTDLETVSLEVAGQLITLDKPPRWRRNGAALHGVHLGDDNAVWPLQRMRRMIQPEDCIAVGDTGGQPLPIAASRLTRDGDAEHWRVEADIPIDQNWHGAVVVSRADGYVVGVLLIDEDDAVAMAPVPPTE